MTTSKHLNRQPDMAADNTLKCEHKLRLRLTELENAAEDGEASAVAERRLIRAKLELIDAEAEMEKVREDRNRAFQLLRRLVDAGAGGSIRFGGHEMARMLQAEPQAKVKALLYEDGTVIELINLMMGEIEFEASLGRRPANPDELLEIRRKYGNRTAKPSADSICSEEGPHGA